MEKASLNGAARSSLRLRWRRFSSSGSVGILGGLLLMILIFGLASPFFFTVENLLNIAKQSSINAVIAFGMTLVIISGGIDLSVGSVVALAAVVMATLMKVNVAVPLAIAAGLAIGAIAGGLNGMFISRVQLAPFIVTLGSMSYLRGLALVFTKGMPVYGVPDLVRWFGNGSVWIIPAPMILAAGMALLSLFLLRRTRFGEFTIAMGGNEEAARLSGVNIVRYKTLVYVFSGLCSVVGAVILMARINAAEPIAGTGFELDAIAAAVMGGTSLSGGVGSIVGTIVGALIIAGLRNGLNLLNVDANWQQVAIGVVIMMAVIISPDSEALIPWCLHRAANDCCTSLRRSRPCPYLAASSGCARASPATRGPSAWSRPCWSRKAMRARETSLACSRGLLPSNGRWREFPSGSTRAS